MDIDLNAPKTNGSLTWPTSGLAVKLPNPGKDKGTIENDSSSSFSAYVGDMSIDEYSAYVDECLAAGFSEGYDRSDELFTAENAAGDSLRVEYKGFNTMYVQIHGADSPSSSDESSTENSDGNTDDSSASSNEIDPDFKSTMDSYEAFMDSYISFMEEYAESGNAVSMAADYASMVSNYADMSEKIDAIDEESLNDAELAYYTEVMTRVDKKLIDSAATA